MAAISDHSVSLSRARRTTSMMVHALELTSSSRTVQADQDQAGWQPWRRARQPHVVQRLSNGKESAWRHALRDTSWRMPSTLLAPPTAARGCHPRPLRHSSGLSPLKLREALARAVSRQTHSPVGAPSAWSWLLMPRSPHDSSIVIAHQLESARHRSCLITASSLPAARCASLETHPQRGSRTRARACPHSRLTSQTHHARARQATQIAHPLSDLPATQWRRRRRRRRP